MNPAHVRAQEILDSIETHLEPVAEAKLWKNTTYSIDVDAEVYAWYLMRHLFNADYTIHPKERELAETILRQERSEVIKFLNNVDKFENILDDGVPEFIEATLMYDESYGSRTTRSIIGLLEQFGTLCIAIDGQKTEDEVNVLTRHIARLIDTSEKRRREIRQQLSKTSNSIKSKVNPEMEQERSLESLLDELRSMIGLERVKEEVSAAVNLVRVRKMREEMGLPAMPMSLHMVFTGSPGTGKTTVARLVALIYKELGLLEEGQLIEVDRSGMIGAYTGQTALKVQGVVTQARGGILFIDEAYALKLRTDDMYGDEAINTLLKAMEDHRDDLVVIVAGYTQQMGEFLETNPGLQSRFNRYIHFEDYNGEELHNIFQRICETNGYTSTQIAAYQLKSHFAKLHAERDQNFGNARTVRNVFETILKHQAARVVTIKNPTPDDLSFIDLADIAWIFDKPAPTVAAKGRA